MRLSTFCRSVWASSSAVAKRFLRAQRGTILAFLVAGSLCARGEGAAIKRTQQPKKSFTVIDEIGLTRFGSSWTAIEERVLFSPDGKYFATETERGRVDLNRVEDSLRFYRSEEIKRFVEHPHVSGPPSPVWVVARVGKEGPVINDWRWLPDSSGVAFLEAESFLGKQRIVLADLRRKQIKIMTSKTDGIGTFDLLERRHYAYTVRVPEERVKAGADGGAAVGTGHSLFELILPNDPVTKYIEHPSHTVWAVTGGKPFMIKHDGKPLKLFGGDLAMSPDGRYVVARVPVSEVPASWETLYPPPFVSDAYRIQAGHYDIKASRVHEYVLIDLHTGSMQPLTDAPTSSDAGWWALGSPSWSSDSREVLLPGTFIRSRDHGSSPPCVAVVDVASRNSTCVEFLKPHGLAGDEPNYHIVTHAYFANGDKRRVVVNSRRRENWAFIGATEYECTASGSWKIVRESNILEGRAEHGVLQIAVKQGLNDPPLLVATSTQRSRVIWDPDGPPLRDIELGQASVYRWKDTEGRERRGGLYKPVDYKPGRRYPLVIQTHGFEESEFLPSGLFTTAFAARELAAVGIMVLQVGDVGDCEISTPNEGPCNAAGYETAAMHLVADGLADPDKIGIIGFSRTCFHVMETLTTGTLHLKAASITDGVMETYSQYLAQINQGIEVDEENSIIGASPFGGGLQQWLKRSPGFNLDKITTPLLVVGGGRVNLLLMWEPYAGLRYLKKPVDLMMLNTDEHILTNPAVRMASQGGSVDWFRFWLKDEEDPDPAKGDQYNRWRGLRRLQEENDRRLTAPATTSQ
jgi:dipeptidyl aminopeptidase/acylaminoacyl peptidase